MDTVSLRLTFVSCAQVYHDYQYLLLCSGQKQEKRLRRFRFICSLLSYNPDQFLDTVTLPQPTAGVGVKADDVTSFFENGDADEVHYEPMLLNSQDTDVDLEIKRAICAELTNGVNRTDDVYNITCGYVSRLLKFLKKNPILAKLFDEKEVIFVLKGSMAQKRVFKAAYPNRVVDIEAAFGNGGDNDCNVLINPRRPDFAAIHRMVVEGVHTFLLQEVPRISIGSVNSFAKAIDSITVAGVQLKVRAHQRQGFHLSADGSGATWCNLQVTRHPVYVSRNDTLDFKDELGNRAKFTLLRLKYAFEVSLHGKGKIFGGEVLDIAVPDQNEYRIGLEFAQYQSGKWTTELDLKL